MASFKDWLDQRKITPEDAAEIFGKSVGTIRNWRSAGVPDLLKSWVDQRMAEIDGPQPILNRVVLEITNEQFESWNAAALESGQLLKEWAIDTLEEAASELDQTGSSHRPDPVALVREPGTAYLPKKEREA